MNGANVATMIAFRTSGRVKNAHDLLVHPLMVEWQNRGLPVVVAGDLNSPSHLDWIEETRSPASEILLGVSDEMDILLGIHTADG